MGLQRKQSGLPHDRGGLKAKQDLGSQGALAVKASAAEVGVESSQWFRETQQGWASRYGQKARMVAFVKAGRSEADTVCMAGDVHVIVEPQQVSMVSLVVNGPAVRLDWLPCLQAAWIHRTMSSVFDGGLSKEL